MIKSRTGSTAFAEIIDENKIQRLLAVSQTFDAARFDEILARALQLKGVTLEDAAFLLALSDRDAIERLTKTAVRIKEEIYGRRLVLFAPLYTSSYCANECLYCGFRASQSSLRSRLKPEQIVEETTALVNMGHKRVLLVAGEDPQLTFEDIAAQVQAVYSVKLPKGNIRRVNVNVAPTSEANFRVIKSAGIGTYQCFQETFHRETYTRMHTKGSKKDYDYRLHVFDRCIKAGIDDFGMGILFGLYDYRFELLAMLQHISWLEKEFSIGPHTISIPRLEPADGSDVLTTSSFIISDLDLIKATAILRLTVPYTGIILSTRETVSMRESLLEVGVSQMSAGSITNPGGYSENSDVVPQFEVQDHRSLDEVIRSTCKSGFIPSFCTGCYRRGRTGEKFQNMAKEQHIGSLCSLNAIITLEEYLLDFASPETRKSGEARIVDFLTSMPEGTNKMRLEKQLAETRAGRRDLLE
ncbi:MAG: [FeFe] hydrogenase H-cluster radical SAM maturase HydG [Candidatus Riflebacteria bacterium]|nr:[FeFe] hydrogenase H-cluster radical SAM maturase HydG [Candidatus Riflebacteria bacterium]